MLASLISKSRSTRDSVLVGLALALAAFALWQALLRRDRAQMAETTEVAAETIADKLTSEIQIRALPLERLAIRWSLREKPRREDWIPEADLFASAYNGYQAIAWVGPDLHVRWFAPLGRNSWLDSLDWSAEPVSRAAFERARKDRTMSASRPLHNLPPAEAMFLICAPFPRGRDRAYIAGLFRTHELLHFILGKNLPTGFSVEVFDGPERLYSNNYGPADKKAHAAERTVSVYGTPWRVRVQPRLESLLAFRSPFPTVILIVGLALSVLVALAVHIAESQRKHAKAVDGLNRDLQAEAAARKRAADDLGRANETLRSVLETCPLAVVGADAAGVVNLWNPAASSLLGWTRAEALGRPAASLCGPTAFRPPAAGTGNVVDTRLARKKGAEVDVQIWSASLPDPAAAKAGALWLVADQTQRKLLERRLRESQKIEAVSRLAGGLAHDFNNLLGIVIGYGEIVRDRLGENAPLQTEVGEILSAANRAASLTAQLLAFGRGQTTEPRDLDLHPAVRALADSLEPLVGDRINVVICPDAPAANVRIDPAQLGQLLDTLALNAADAMPDGGSVFIDTSVLTLDRDAAARLELTPGRYAVLAVSDTGAGMTEEVRAHAFEPFYTTKRLGRGSGLGLSTVYGIVKQNHGAVALETSPGHGATFRLYFPAIES